MGNSVRLSGPLRARQGGPLMDACWWAHKTQVNWWPAKSTSQIRIYYNKTPVLLTLYLLDEIFNNKLSKWNKCFLLHFKHKTNKRSREDTFSGAPRKFTNFGGFKLNWLTKSDLWCAGSVLDQFSRPLVAWFCPVSVFFTEIKFDAEVW